MANHSCYVFHGSATGVAARIRRPVDLTLPVQAASSLPVNGGICENKVGPMSFGPRTPPSTPATRGLTSMATEYLTFDSASTRVTGDYMDTEQAVAMTRGEVACNRVPALTHVSAEVVNLTVIGRVKVNLATLGLQSQTSSDTQPSIRCDGCRLEGITVDGYPLEIVLDPAFFSTNDTMAKLATAAAAGANPHFFTDAGTAASYGFFNTTGLVKCTLVTSMKWAADPHPDAVIDGNTIAIPNFGTVYFAEMFVGTASRRLTMVRFQLGSDDGGDASAGSGDTNGSSWPPIAP